MVKASNPNEWRSKTICQTVVLVGAGVGEHSVVAVDGVAGAGAVEVAAGGAAGGGVEDEAVLKM